MNQPEHHQEHFMDPSKYMPGVSIDCVVVGFDLEELHILLLKWKDEELWMLPGSWSSERESSYPILHSFIHLVM